MIFFIFFVFCNSIISLFKTVVELIFFKAIESSSMPLIGIMQTVSFIFNLFFAFSSKILSLE